MAEGQPIDQPHDRDREPSPTLAYAPPPRWGRRRLWRFLIATILIAFTIATVKWGPDGWRRARLLYWQRQCLRCTAPADQVVFEGSMDTTAALVKDPKFIKDTLPPNLQFASRKAPAALRRLETSAGTMLWTFPLGGRETQAPPAPSTAASSPSSLSIELGGIAFMHERTSKSGTRRLVIVSGVLPLGVGLYTTVTPATWRSGPGGAGTLRLQSFEPVELERLYGKFRVFAGQPDPADQSHFTVEYEADGQRGVIHGYLQGDGTVKFNRHGQPPSVVANTTTTLTVDATITLGPGGNYTLTMLGTMAGMPFDDDVRFNNKTWVVTPNTPPATSPAANRRPRGRRGPSGF